MKAIINIQTFKTTSPDAKHYYGTLKVIDKDFITLKRPITEKEITDYPDRFYRFKEGDLTECFLTWKDVVLAGGNIAKQLDINLQDIVVDGIPYTGRKSYHEALSPLDTRPKCKSCGKLFGPKEGLYNTPIGLFCVNCYERIK